MAPSLVGSGREDAHPPLVALTFDDGPSATTPRVLDALARRGVAATFFVLGGQVAAGAELLVRARDAGHELGNHSWSHPDLDVRKDVDLDDEIARTSDAIERASSVRPRLFRPPYGHDAGRWARAAARAGLATVLWSVQTWDWEEESDADAIASRALAGLHPGAIVLLHDGERHDPHATVTALPSIVQGLREAGYAAVTVSQLLAPAPG